MHFFWTYLRFALYCGFFSPFFTPTLPHLLSWLNFTPLSVVVYFFDYSRNIPWNISYSKILLILLILIVVPFFWIFHIPNLSIFLQKSAKTLLKKNIGIFHIPSKPRKLLWYEKCGIFFKNWFFLKYSWDIPFSKKIKYCCGIFQCCGPILPEYSILLIFTFRGIFRGNIPYSKWPLCFVGVKFNQAFF